MIIYKVDNQTQTEVSTQIKDMGAVLSEISPTLRILKELLSEHKTAISQPSIDKYREELLTMLFEAIRLTHQISINAQRLSSISEQATKHMATLENQIAAALQGRTMQAQDSRANSQQPAIVE